LIWVNCLMRANRSSL